MMARIEINTLEAGIRNIELAAPVIVIGRDDSAHVRLINPYVSGKHARIIKDNGHFYLEDMGSANGTFVNEQEVLEKTPLKDRDVIGIGEYSLRFRDGEKVLKKASENVPQSQPLPVSSEEKRVFSEAPKKELSDKPGDEAYINLKDKVIDLTRSRMNLRKLSAEKIGDDELHRRTETQVDEILAELASKLPSSIDKARFKKDVIDDLLGLGPLEDLLEDERITEIMVNSAEQIYIECDGKLKPANRKFRDDAHVLSVIQRIVSPVGRAINESTPLVDARLKDGSRVNAIIPPLALKGPSLTIRKFSKRRLGPEDVLKFGSASENMLEFLKLAVRERKNIVISGGTGSGKTTLLNILSGFIPNGDRIVTVEDAAELRLNQDHIVSLESRPPNIEGAGAITIRDLVKNCLRMRPDRIVVGECRGGEALDMLQAMNTGHDGSLTTAHANSPRDVLSRLETMVLMSGMDLPVRAIRDQISAAVDLIVQQSRLPDGSRKITYITEVTGMEGDVILTQDIFRFKQEGFDSSGKVIGRFVCTGVVPNFVRELQERGISINLNIFQSEQE